MNSMNREMAISPVFFPGKFYEQRGLSARTCVHVPTQTHTRTHTHTHVELEKTNKQTKKEQKKIQS